jgi:hypothetical protein
LALASTSPRRQNAFRIEGSRITANDLAALVQDVRKQTLLDQSKTVTVSRVTSSELHEKWEKDVNDEDFVTDMLAVYDQGFGIVGPKGGNWREWWPEWNPLSVMDVARAKFLSMN